MGQRAIRNWIRRHSYHSAEQAVKNKKLDHRVKSGEWKQPVLDIAGDVEGGDERQDRLLGLRLAVMLYPAMRKANKTK